jgi:hypothetical protein
LRRSFTNDYYDWKVSNFLLCHLQKNYYYHIVPSDEWCLDKEIGSGHFYLRRDSSKVKFRCEVEVLEFVRDPEEELLGSRSEIYYSYRDCQTSSNPIIVISTCIAALAVTVLLPWMIIATNEPIE